MELKVTGTVPFWLTRMLGEHGCILRSHSKYCNALERGDPVLRKMLYGGPNRINMPGGPPLRGVTVPQVAGPTASATTTTLV
jgi:hypothetical protein